MSTKKGTPYEAAHAYVVCIYCGEVFTTNYQYDGRYTVISCRKQLEGHYMARHMGAVK